MASNNNPTQPPKPGNTVNDRTYQEVEYLKKNLGPILVAALAEICIRRPSDPIEYLGHWLLRWRYNEELKRRDVQTALDAVRQRQQDQAEEEDANPELVAEVANLPVEVPDGFMSGPLEEETDELEAEEINPEDEVPESEFNASEEVYEAEQAALSQQGMNGAYQPGSAMPAPASVAAQPPGAVMPGSPVKGAQPPGAAMPVSSAPPASRKGSARKTSVKSQQPLPGTAPSKLNPTISQAGAPLSPSKQLPPAASATNAPPSKAPTVPTSKIGLDGEDEEEEQTEVPPTPSKVPPKK